MRRVDFLLVLAFVTSIFYQSLAQKNDNPCDVRLTQKLEDDEICNFVEIMPSFTAYEGNFVRYVHNALVYPEGKINQQENNYVISFVINRCGKLVRPKVEKKVLRGHAEIEQAIIKVLRKSPKWTVGIEKGKKVPVRFKMTLRINTR